jgi:esterase/lipase
MQSTVTATTPTGRTVVGWLHRASRGSGTLVVLCHGHNANGTHGRFIELAKWLEHLGYDCLRWSVTRTELLPGVLEVTTISEEVEQATALVRSLRDRYRHVVAVGHSQGGVMCLALAHAHLADAVVQLMSVADEKLRIKLMRERFDQAEKTNGIARYASHSAGKTFGYTQSFFQDYERWHLAELLKTNTAPILFVLGSRDERVTPAEVRAGFEIAGGDKELFVIDEGHDFSPATAAVLGKKVAQWLHEHLP